MWALSRVCCALPAEVDVGTQRRAFEGIRAALAQMYPVPEDEVFVQRAFAVHILRDVGKRAAAS